MEKQPGRAVAAPALELLESPNVEHLLCAGILLDGEATAVNKTDMN